jgi:hypothetical protein
MPRGLSEAAFAALPIAENWRNGPAKALERQYATLVETEPVKS